MEVYRWGVSLSPPCAFPFPLCAGHGEAPMRSAVWVMDDDWRSLLSTSMNSWPFLYARLGDGRRETSPIYEAHVWMTGAGLQPAELDAHTMAADQRGFNIICHNRPLSLNSGRPPPLMSLKCFNPILSAYIFYTHNFRYLKTSLGQGKVSPHMTPARVF